jgi:hypothetical protein
VPHDAIHPVVESVGDAMSDQGLTPISYVCCGTRLRRIDIDTGSSSLTFTFCGRCEQMRWFSDGTPVTREDATMFAGSMPSRPGRPTSRGAAQG